MTEGIRRRGVLVVAGVVLVTAAACSVIRPLIFPVKYDRVSMLDPVQERNEGYSLGEDGALSYEIEGLRIDVKYMPDPELNALFPEESSQGRYSINPYTYGDYVDPKVGHVRNRFTVFEVTVTNINFAKVELQPLECLLTTDRPGEALTAYGVLSGSAPDNFESYYRALKGPSGNEDYRFNMRMGLVRTNNYTVGEKIFKGEQYSGFIIYDPLADQVNEATLHIRDFILKFSAFGKALETMDVSFRFERSVRQQVMQYEEALDLAQAFTEARLSAASQVLGNVTGDVTRDVTAIDGLARFHLKELNDCFEGPFMEGKASEGEVTVRFVILPSGQVEEAQILKSTVVSDEVGRCVADEVAGWRLQPSRGVAASPSQTLQEGDGEPGERPPTPAAPAPDIATSAARVTATVFLEFSDIRRE